MSYLRFLCLFAYKWCPPHIVLWFLFCLSSSYVPMLPVSVDCAFSVYLADTAGLW
jgi:hypothetical protein